MEVTPSLHELYMEDYDDSEIDDLRDAVDRASLRSSSDPALLNNAPPIANTNNSNRDSDPENGNGSGATTPSPLQHPTTPRKSKTPV